MDNNKNINEEVQEKKIKKQYIIFGIVAIILIFLAVLAFSYFQKPKERVTIGTNTIDTLSIDGNQTDVEEINNKLASKYVYFSGFDNSTVNADSKIKLNNLETNQDFLMQYQIYEADKLVYETGLIKSGNSVYWQIGDTLGIGEHNLTIRQNPYYDVDGKGNYLPLTYGSCTVIFTVVE